MKHLVSLVFVCLGFMVAKAQSSVSGNPPLFITTNKTTSLIFPSAIRHVDLGTKDILAQQVKEAENLLFVKASIPNFKQTNLSVVTADGQLYSFDVSYDSTPLLLVYRLTPLHVNEIVSFSDEVMNSAKVENYAKALLNGKRCIRGIKDNTWEMSARVNGIYIKDNVLFYQLRLANESAINYDINFIRFYILDKKKPKRTASQEIELKPLCIVGNPGAVNGNSKTNIVVALEKFTIPDAKYLAIEIKEKNGGRNLLLKVSNKKLIKAKARLDYSIN